MTRRPVERNCYCDLWEKDPQFFEAKGVPRGYCGICDCGAPGHTRHYPGPVPVTATWCDECYSNLPTVPVMMRLYQVLVVLFLLGVGALIWVLLR